METPFQERLFDRCLPTLRYLILWWQGQQVFGLVVNRSQWHTKQYHLASSYDLPVRWGWHFCWSSGSWKHIKNTAGGKGKWWQTKPMVWHAQVRTKSRRWMWKNDCTWLRHAQLNKFWLNDGRVRTKLCRMSGHFVSQKFWKCDSLFR